MNSIYIDEWRGVYRVQVRYWFDGLIYCNVAQYAHGQSKEQPPKYGEKTVYITDNENGQRIVRDFRDSLIQHIAGMPVLPDGYKTVLTF